MASGDFRRITDHLTKIARPNAFYSALDAGIDEAFIPAISASLTDLTEFYVPRRLGVPREPGPEPLSRLPRCLQDCASPTMRTGSPHVGYLGVELLDFILN